MNSESGGMSSNDRQRRAAAEIARKKVLDAYSSTLNAIKNLPASSKDILVNRHINNQPEIISNPNWMNNPTDNPYSATRSEIYTADSTPQPPEQHQLTQPENNYQSQSSYTEEPALTGYDNIATNTEHAALYNTSNSDYSIETNSSNLKDTPINQESVDEGWQKYHSAWQDYYKNYYNDYYSKAAQTYLATEKMKSERIANGKVSRARRIRHLLPFTIIGIIILVFLFLQYNRLIFAPIMAYVSPDSSDSVNNIIAIDPTITQAVSPEPRLIIPKLNIDVPVAFAINPSDVMEAMNHGVAQFYIPGANALPGQIGNLVISGHSAGDIYSSNPYKFIFSGLERLENGDLIYVNYESTRYTYQMTRREVVEPNNVAALIYETNKPMLTLITCTPLGTSRYRLLITAEQISPSYTDSEIATPAPETPDTSTDPSMPANEPSFFENIWRGIFGN